MHDNEHPHTAVHTVQTLHELRRFKILEHFSDSPGHTSSDYHRFGPFKDALRGHLFAMAQNVKDAVERGTKWRELC